MCTHKVSVFPKELQGVLKMYFISAIHADPLLNKIFRQPFLSFPTIVLVGLQLRVGILVQFEAKDLVKTKNINPDRIAKKWYRIVQPIYPCQ